MSATIEQRFSQNEIIELGRFHFESIQKRSVRSPIPSEFATAVEHMGGVRLDDCFSEAFGIDDPLKNQLLISRKLLVDILDRDFPSAMLAAHALEFGRAVGTAKLLKSQERVVLRRSREVETLVRNHGLREGLSTDAILERIRSEVGVSVPEVDLGEEESEQLPMIATMRMIVKHSGYWRKALNRAHDLERVALTFTGRMAVVEKLALEDGISDLWFQAGERFVEGPAPDLRSFNQNRRMFEDIFRYPENRQKVRELNW